MFVFITHDFQPASLCIGFYTITVIFQELSHEVGKLSFSYEAEVKRWSNSDFKFSYTVSPLTNNFSISTEIYIITHDHQCKRY